MSIDELEITIEETFLAESEGAFEAYIKPLLDKVKSVDTSEKGYLKSIKENLNFYVMDINIETMILDVVDSYISNVYSLANDRAPIAEDVYRQAVNYSELELSMSGEDIDLQVEDIENNFDSGIIIQDGYDGCYLEYFTLAMMKLSLVLPSLNPSVLTLESYKNIVPEFFDILRCLERGKSELRTLDIKKQLSKEKKKQAKLKDENIKLQKDRIEKHKSASKGGKVKAERSYGESKKYVFSRTSEIKSKNSKISANETAEKIYFELQEINFKSKVSQTPSFNTTYGWVRKAIRDKSILMSA